MMLRRCYCLILIALLGTLVLCGCDNDVTVKKPFTLAYVDRNWRLRIRWSDDGTTWSSASGATPDADRAPGIAANAEGVLYLAVFVDGFSRARMMMGLGPAIWDSSSVQVGDGHTGDIDSATSIVHVDGQKWLVAFQDGNQARVYEFDTTSTVRDLGADVTPVSGVMNANLDDRPAMVNMGGRLIVSWLMKTKQVQIVTGNIVDGAPEWDAGYIFSTPEPGFLAPEGGHDLAQDGETFYLAVIRERVPEADQILKRFFLFIYTSTDGLHWSRLASREVKISHAVSIAARAPDDIIAITSSSAYNKVHRFNGSSWSFLDESTVFGGNLNNGGHDLTLYVKD